MALQRHLGAVHAHFVRILTLLFVLVGFVLACATPSFAQGDGKSVNSPFLKDSLSDTFTVLQVVANSTQRTLLPSTLTVTEPLCNVVKHWQTR